MQKQASGPRAGQAAAPETASPPRAEGSDDSLAADRAGLGRLLALVGTAWVASSAEYLSLGFRPGVVVNLAAGGSLLLLSWRSRRATSRRELLVLTQLMAALFVLGVAAGTLLTGQADSMLGFFFAGVPLAVAFHGGRRLTLVWFAISLVAALGVGLSGWLSPLANPLPASPVRQLLGWCALLLVVTGYAVAYRARADRLVEVEQSRRAELEEALHEVRRVMSWMGAMQATLPVGVLLTDEHGRIVLVNDALRRMTGLPLSIGDASHVALRDFAPKLLDGEETVRRLIRAGMAAEPFDGVQVTLRDGRTFEVDHVPVVSLGHRNGSLWSYRDVSHRLQVDRMKDEFVGTVSHELRTPLTSIRGALRLMQSGALGAVPHEMSELLGIADRNAARLIRMVNDLLDLQKMDAGHLVLQLQPVSTDRLARAAREEVAPLLAEHGLTLRLEEEGSLLVRVDHDRTVQVLVNLLSNAIKFSPVGGAICLTVRGTGSEARFSVSDEGPGIPAEALGRLFVRFQQLDGSASRLQAGSGLGLAISKSLVERQGGRIGAESVVGRGATFWFTLPTRPNSLELPSM